MFDRKQAILLHYSPQMLQLNRQDLPWKVDIKGLDTPNVGNRSLMSDGFAIRLRQLRKQKNLSQSELAKIVGVHYNHIGRYERGSSNPSADALGKLAEALGVSTDYLLDGSNEDAAKADFEDRELLRQFQQVEKLPEEDKVVIKKLLDAFLTKKQIQKLVAS